MVAGGMVRLAMLQRLEQARQREVDQLTSELGAQEQLRQRYQRNLARLSELTEGAGPSGVMPPRLASVCADYKLSLMGLAAEHARDLRRHEQEMGATRHRLAEATRRHQVAEHLRQQEESTVLRARQLREQKTQDEIAGNVWQRSRNH